MAVQSSRCGPVKKDNNKLRTARSKGQMTAFVTGQQDPATARLGKTVSDPRISFTPATLLTTGSCVRVRIRPIARTLKTLKSMSCTDQRAITEAHPAKHHSQGQNTTTSKLGQKTAPVHQVTSSVTAHSSRLGYAKEPQQIAEDKQQLTNVFRHCSP